MDDCHPSFFFDVVMAFSSTVNNGDKGSGINARSHSIAKLVGW